MSETTIQIKAIIDRFQEGYLHRDPEALEAFMDLFCDDDRLEVIGTGAHIQGEGEWCLDKTTLRRMISGDWEGWGDLRLALDQLNIHVHGDTAWFAVPGTVSRTTPPDQSCQNFMGYLKWVTENEPEVPAREKLLDVLRGGIITLAEADRGATYIWPLRLTGVLIRQADRWRFCQMTFSFPTIYPPDIRLTE